MLEGERGQITNWKSNLKTQILTDLNVNIPVSCTEQA